MRVHLRADRSGPEPGPGESWPLAYVDILEAHEQENIARSALDRWILAGAATLDRGKLVLHSKPKLVYRLVRGPGRYCCHCWAPLDSEAAAAEHVAEAHPDEPSPDPNNPSGWCVNDFYMCEKEG